MRPPEGANAMPERAATPDPARTDEVQESISLADVTTLTNGRATPGPYTLGPDSTAQEDTPRGALTQHHWISERIYPGVERDYWVYVPAQYDGSQPACLMVFQDGPLYLAPEANIPVAFDNLIHQG